jgi:hypothetical protein
VQWNGGDRVKSGFVTGVAIRSDHVSVVLTSSDDPESVVKVCISDKAKAIRPGDFIWTQSGLAMWTSIDLKVEDVQLKIHRTLSDGKHPCCDVKAVS